MKKFTLLFYTLFITIISFAQIPNWFNYQTIIRDSNGLPITNKQISITLGIRSQTADGPLVYGEEHDTETDKHGMVSLIIGEGTTNDNLSSIDWSLGNYFLSVSVDNVDYGASKLMAVPFAMYASKAENGMTQNQADAIKANTAKVGITNNQAAAITANTAKVGITNNQAAAITAVSYTHLTLPTKA